MQKVTVQGILRENERRRKQQRRPFDPVTGVGAPLERFAFKVSDMPVPVQWLPVQMKDKPLVKALMKYRTVKNFIAKYLKEEYTEENVDAVVDEFSRLREKYDFCYWARVFAVIKRKEVLPGQEPYDNFILNAPQCKLVGILEEMRLKGMPIRIVLLKARQWGGSTLVQVYMFYLQTVHVKGLNSLVVAQVRTQSLKVQNMFKKLMEYYPMERLYDTTDAVPVGEEKTHYLSGDSSVVVCDARSFQISIGTAEKPESIRGDSISLVHCSEVGLWKTTEGKTPEDMVQSATSGILLRPYTLIVYESTAKGTGNFFHREWIAAKMGLSQFTAVFVAWFEIELYQMEVPDSKALAKWLIEHREQQEAPNDREEPGCYYWWLWNEKGATLENIYWYMEERRKYRSHGAMASEYPSDDIEAFVHSGTMVFDRYLVEKLRPACSSAKYTGELCATGTKGRDALQNIHFVEDAASGRLSVWEHPEEIEGEKILHRYLVAVDIGGRGEKADYSVIIVFDRYWMMYGDKPAVVAQWYGHIDHDILAWKAAQIAKYYDNALLVIESNTLETKDPAHDVDGDQAGFILNQIKEVYDNLYARDQSEEDIAQGRPVKYGFHTNVSTKPLIISGLVEVIRDGLYVERDERCLDEYLAYEKKVRPVGAFGAVEGHHDDILMTRAIGLYICFYKMPRPVSVNMARESAMRMRRHTERPSGLIATI